MMRNTMTLALGAILALSGCGWGSGAFWTGDEPGGWDEPGSTSYGLRTVTWSQLDGELGGHRLALVDVQGSATGGYGTSIEIETLQDGSWVLFRLTADQDLYAPDLDGARLQSANGDYVDLMGCTGDAPYEYDYDGYADDVTVEVFDGLVEGTRRVDITATFNDGFSEREIRGTVVLDLNDVTDTGWTDDTRTPPGYEDDYTYTEGAATWDTVTTNLGPDGAYELSAIDGRTRSGRFNSSIELDITVDGRWTMFALSLNADLNELEPGSTVEGGDLLGCVGPAPGDYDYDGHADDVQLQILEGTSPFERIGHLTGTFSTEWGPQTVDATFTYEVF